MMAQKCMAYFEDAVGHMYCADIIEAVILGRRLNPGESAAATQFVRKVSFRLLLAGLTFCPFELLLKVFKLLPHPGRHRVCRPPGLQFRDSIFYLLDAFIVHHFSPSAT